MKNTEFTQSIIKKWSSKTLWTDEDYYNELLESESEFKKRHRWLSPDRYWNVAQSGLGYLPWKQRLEEAVKHVPKGIRLFHANFAVGMKEKVELLETIRKEVWSWNREL